MYFAIAIFHNILLLCDYKIVIVDDCKHRRQQDHELKKKKKKKDALIVVALYNTIIYNNIHCAIVGIQYREYVNVAIV